MGSVHKRTFDGLFTHGVPLDEELKAALRGVGYDPDAPQDRYEASVWREAVLVVRRHLYGELPDEEALRALGRRFVSGYARTVVGAVFAAAAPLLGPDRVILRLPRYLSTARDDLRLEVIAEGRACWRAEFVGPSLPQFVAGTVEAILLLTRSEPQVSVISQSAEGFALRIAWTRNR